MKRLFLKYGEQAIMASAIICCAIVFADTENSEAAKVIMLAWIGLVLIIELIERQKRY